MYQVGTKVHSTSLNQTGGIMRVRDSGHYMIDIGDGYYEVPSAHTPGENTRFYDSNRIVRTGWLPESDLTHV